MENAVDTSSEKMIAKFEYLLHGISTRPSS